MKVIDVLGMHITDYPLKEAIKLSLKYIGNGAMNTIFYLSSQVLLDAGENAQQREWLESMDLLLYGEPTVLDVLKEKGLDVHIIRMYQYKEWTDIIDEIRESELILSSSLHGLIVSDAYSIPNVFCEFIYHHPNYTKYEDYYMSINKNFNIPINYKDIKVNEIDNYINNYDVPNIDIEELRMLFISILKS